MADPVVRLQALDGAWEVCGVDRLAGIVPEDLQASANGWGSDTCSFTLRRDPGAVHPDLTAFTPCDIEIEGELVWSGRVKETPTKDGTDSQINVQGQGWQFHLDDDVYERKYVHTRLGDYKDTRSFLDATLTNWYAGGQVSTGGGLTLMMPADVEVPDDRGVSVTLDLGEDQFLSTVSVDWESSNNHADLNFFVESGDGVDFSAGDISAIADFAMNTGVSGTTTADAAAGRRYLHLYLWNGSGGPVTPTADVWIKVTGARVFRLAAYRSGADSVLQAPAVVADARDAATQLLSDSDDLIDPDDTVEFSLPELALEGLKTPREVLSGVNAFHFYMQKVDVDKRVVFQPQPPTPLFEVGEWSGADFEDASANSGEEIYNRCVVEAQGPDGSPLRVERWSPPVIDMSGFAQPANPSADVNVANWTTDTGFTRDTTTFDTSPASFKFDSLAQEDPIQSDTVTQTLTKNRRYGLRLKLKTTGTTRFTIAVVDQAASTLVSRSYSESVASFEEFTVDWTQPFDATGYAVQLTLDLGNFWWVDSIQVGAMRSTVIDRRAFRRTKILPVQSALTEAAAEQIGDTYLLNHKTTPFKGSLTVTGQTGVRRVQGGAGVHPAHLLTQTGELVRFSHRIDPDTGNHGREGRIASVSYTHKDAKASVQIDNERQNFEALLARYGALTAPG